MINDTITPFPADSPVHQLFEHHARITPEALAVVDGPNSLTYGDLDRRASALATQIRREPSREPPIVGIACEPGTLRIIAVLAVLKAGAAYLPLDVGYPDDRLVYMLRDSNVSLVLAEGASVPRLRSADIRVCDLEQMPPEIPATFGEVRGGGPASIAYVIYTSGSTGRPKGVVSGHCGLVNRLTWMKHHYKVGPADRILHKTSFGFDVSVWELLLPLISGAVLVMAPRAAQRDLMELVRTIQRHGVTMLHFVPSVLDAFVEMPGVEACKSVRVVISSGEALSGSTRRRFYSRLAAQLHNLYGPTEASIDVTHYHCRPDDTEMAVAIGRPIWNTRVYILDASLREVARGATGEICLGGVGLAYGYLNQPALTAERFVPDGFASQVGERIYRTGDLGRFREDGVIEYGGRRDHQVKLRGFRVELGEIERTILGDSDMRQAVVVMREDRPGQKRMVAYVVGAAGECDSETASLKLKQRLRRLLPDYMIPFAIVWMAALPLTTSGKVDRAALPPPLRQRQDR